MRRCLIVAVAGAAVLSLASCAGGPAPTPAPSSATAPAAATSGEDFAAIASRMNSPRLMAMVLLRKARASHDADRALMASLFAAQAGDYDLASEAARLAHQYDPKRPEPFAVGVKIALDRGEVADARKSAVQAYALGGADALELALSGPIDPWFSYTVLQPIARAHPKDPALQLLWAQTALTAGDSATALAAARASGDPAAGVIEIQAMWDLGQRKQALALAQKTLADRSHDAGLRVFVAGLLARSDQEAEAREVLADAEALAPDNPHVALAFALVEASSGDTGAARSRLTTLLENGSDAPGVYNLLGRMAAQSGDWAEAFGWYEGIEDGDYVDSSQVAAALALARWQGPDAALDYLSHLRQAFPALDPTWAGAEATVLDDSGKPKAAYGAVSAAVKTYPMVRPLRYQQALLADETGDSGPALEALHQLVEEEPQNAQYLNAYGYMLVERTQRYRQAYDYIARALESAPDDGAILDSMGWVLFKMGEAQQALPYLSRAWNLTGDSEVAAHLVRVYLSLGDTARASSLLATALDKSPDDAGLLELKRQIAAGKPD